MFIDKLTFLGLDYRVASLIILNFVVPGISIPKIRLIEGITPLYPNPWTFTIQLLFQDFITAGYTPYEANLRSKLNKNRLLLK